jgi:hypothetical protein
MSALRHDLLRGHGIMVAGDVPETIRGALIGLGARVDELEDGLDEQRAEEWARARAPLGALLFDARGVFGRGGSGALRATLEQAWTAIHALANGTLIPGPEASKIMLIAPAPDAGPHAEAARSAIENLARTLSVEWARYGVSTTALEPGPATTDEQLAELVCYLASPAGDYLSGCRLDLGVVRPAGRN